MEIIEWNGTAQLSGIMQLKGTRKAAKLANLRIKKIFGNEKRNGARFKKDLKKGSPVSPKASKRKNAAQKVPPKQKGSKALSPAKKGKKAKKLKVANKKASKSKAKTGRRKPLVANRRPPKKIKATKVQTKRKVVAKKGKGAKPHKRPTKNPAVETAGQVIKVLNRNPTKGRPIKAAVNVICTKCNQPIFHSYFSQAKGVCECRGANKATFGAFWQTSVPDDDKVKTTAIYRIDNRTLCSRTRTDRGEPSRVNMVLTMEHGSFVFGPQTKSSN